MLERPAAVEAIRKALGRAPVVVLTGPRQCGKTTLARCFLEPDSVNYFDLESPPSLSRLDEPMTALAPLRDLVVIDEVQLRADLFPALRVLVDRPDCPARFLILGSASGNLQRQTSESLAGRVERVLLGGFTAPETAGHAADAHATLWRRGGLPRSFLAATEEDSVVWRREYIQTLLERDFPPVGGAGSGRGHGTLLDHGGSLPRSDLERGRAGAGSGRESRRGSPLPRHPHRRP